jgi:outer membrane lipoprotein-sorting protein
MRSNYTNTKAINGQSTKFKKLSLLLLCFVVIGLASAAVYAIINDKVSPPNTAPTEVGLQYGSIQQNTAPVEVRLPYGSIQELSDRKAFMAAYLSVNCKPDLLRGIQTIRAAGTIESGGEDSSFTLIKKRPDKMRFTIKRGLQEVIFGVSDDTVWQCIRSPQQEDQFARIEGEEASAWVAQTRFFDWIISANQGKGEIVGIEVEQWAGNDSLKVGVIDAYGNTYAIFIDPQTLYPLAERRTLPDGKITETIYNDYRDVDGLPTPFQLTITRDNKVVSKIQLNNSAINVGLLSKLFELPNALL